MTTWETQVDFDIAESGIFPMSTRELIELAPASQHDDLLDELLDTRLGYSEANGTAELRQELASVYRHPAASANNILVTTGAIEANFVLFNTLLEAGDHVIAVYPAYQQLYSVPRAIGCEVDLWKLKVDNGFRFDLDALEELIRPETKLVVINTPHNPTGAVLSAAEMERIYALCESNDAWLMSDEAYRWLDLPGSEPLVGPARDLGSSAISTGTFSKPFGLPGLRLGWIAGPEPVIEACWGMRDFLTLSPGKLNDRLALLAFQHRDQIVERTHRIVEENLDFARGWFAEHSEFASWTPPNGGLLALMKYQLDIPSLELANRLAGEYSVMLAPGSAFGFEGYLRIGIGQKPEIFREGLSRTAACFADLRARGIELVSPVTEKASHV